MNLRSTPSISWINLSILILLLICLYSCVPYKKTLLLRDKKSKYQDTIPTSLTYYKLQSNDILAIHVSSFNTQVSEFYNLKNDGGIGGFLVKKNGYVNIPMLDSMYVLGSTVPEVEKKVTAALQEQIKVPYVVVRLVNFKIVFLGEVGSPGVINVKDNSINIFEALALAGNISDLGNNTDVKIVRKKSNEQSYIIKVDLTSKDIISSPYFYLQPNDVVYIQPLRVKNFKTNFQTFSIILSMTTFAIVILNFVNTYKR